jgi:hypothetical protein
VVAWENLPSSWSELGSSWSELLIDSGFGLWEYLEDDWVDVGNSWEYIFITDPPNIGSFNVIDSSYVVWFTSNIPSGVFNIIALDNAIFVGEFQTNTTFELIDAVILSNVNGYIDAYTSIDVESKILIDIEGAKPSLYRNIDINIIGITTSIDIKLAEKEFPPVEQAELAININKADVDYEIDEPSI